jgi:DNA-binding transcriptional LysR family regulator
VFTHILINKIKEYHEKYPAVKLVLNNCTSQETIEHLKNKKGDIGFVNLPVDDKDTTLSSTVMQLNDTFIASEKYKDLSEKVIPLKSLQDYPLLMLEQNTSTRQAIINYSHSIGIHLHPEIELASLELMIELAKNGMGIACAPREFVEHEIEDEKSLFEIKTFPSLPVRAIGMILPKDEVVPYSVKEFINIMNK